MEARLKLILSLLESLAAPLQNETKELSSELLSRSIEILHSERRHKYHDKNPTFLPSSLRFKFTFTCKAEYEDNKEFKEQLSVPTNY